jgi:hypothetical protein
MDVTGTTVVTDGNNGRDPATSMYYICTYMVCAILSRS